ncbi:S8 family serine peptidase [Desulfatiglans anilini]|uniref:S8 family serine peptidase n=1 Tax=Desulfatiglans anilini TaxID=90728 RepID=UPI0003FD2BB4|nr:S8 family serine peptidase [Desulfatiglans anilini]
MSDKQACAPRVNRLLLKLQPSSPLKAAESRANLRPLYDTPQAKAAMLGFGAEPQWFLADLPEGAANPWDLVHQRVAGELGISESDVVFIEPDMIHNIYRDTNERRAGQVFAVGEKCESTPQDGGHGKAHVPGVFAWHLGDSYTQLGKAREAVAFSDPRTRIAHLDTGYYRAHCTTPSHVLTDLERNFVSGDADPHSAEDPDNRRLLLDNSGHGTGTISILAGGRAPDYGDIALGGAPEAEILPLRIADSVVLLYTSAFAQALDYAVSQRCDVVTMSMGGLPSRAWREAVDKAYLSGLCLVAAAGNNVNGLPTRHIVYPAHYSRVLAVCGAMADSRPYSGLEGMVLEGNYGPRSRMAAALSAHTPNIPWACYGCKSTVRLDGEGTSAATPQVAAAAALWFEKHKQDLPRDWRRVEAVRHALFKSAKVAGIDKDRMGQGILRAFDALGVKPVLGLEQSKSDSDSFAFLRVITGLGVIAAPPRERMFNLEIAQRWMLNPELQTIVPDPDAAGRIDDKAMVQFMEAVIEDPDTSQALRRHLIARYPVVAGKPLPPTETAMPVTPVGGAFGPHPQPAIGDPPYRKIRVYGVDPSLSTRLETAGINEVALKVRWESLKKGPCGEYLAVHDRDDVGRIYEPVDLDDPRMLAQDGWAPSEGNPQFHQQMVYAVAMKTVEHFEQALGRPVLWRPRPNPEDPDDDADFVGQLAVRPHALHQANAYYSPQEVALLFGYFEAAAGGSGEHVPGSRVYACLSHDIIAHETTHAVLDGMHRRFSEPTNPDVLALHEAFADMVALMQHFTIPEILNAEIRRTRGDLEAESMLGSLAIQFGRAMGGRGALRNAIGTMEGGVWKRSKPDPEELEKRLTPHARGAILVAAVFDAFLAIYKARIADLLRIYTGGTGVLPQGAIHPDLAGRLAEEAVKSAGHVLKMCIRALDYLPPVDVTFFEYLRALITADFDLVADDRYNYRVAFVEAFRRHGIYPVNLNAPSEDTLRTLSVDTLRWQGFDWSNLTEQSKTLLKKYKEIIKDLKQFADKCLYIGDRRALFDQTRRQRVVLHRQLQGIFEAAPDFALELGLDPALKRFEVHELRRALRIDSMGKPVPQVIVALTQSKTIKENRKNGTPEYRFRGGSTLIVDLSVPEVKYRIVKHIQSDTRQTRTLDFVREAAADPLRALFLMADRGEPFAALHALADDGV